MRRTDVSLCYTEPGARRTGARGTASRAATPAAASTARQAGFRAAGLASAPPRGGAGLCPGRGGGVERRQQHRTAPAALGWGLGAVAGRGVGALGHALCDRPAVGLSGRHRRWLPGWSSGRTRADGRALAFWRLALPLAPAVRSAVVRDGCPGQGLLEDGSGLALLPAVVQGERLLQLRAIAPAAGPRRGVASTVPATAPSAPARGGSATPNSRAARRLRRDPTGRCPPGLRVPPLEPDRLHPLGEPAERPRVPLRRQGQLRRAPAAAVAAAGRTAPAAGLGAAGGPAQPRRGAPHRGGVQPLRLVLEGRRLQQRPRLPLLPRVPAGRGQGAQEVEARPGRSRRRRPEHGDGPGWRG
mmetsp:Transcript_54911/g.170072  ORF Transcript_54911/g.170072 Transcript_54911/m.170072 type:complete len:357 (+) Transcript_54911:121-1191(+)